MSKKNQWFLAEAQLYIWYWKKKWTHHYFRANNSENVKIFKWFDCCHCPNWNWRQSNRFFVCVDLQKLFEYFEIINWIIHNGSIQLIQFEVDFCLVRPNLLVKYVGIWIDDYIIVKSLIRFDWNSSRSIQLKSRWDIFCVVYMCVYRVCVWMCNVWTIECCS